MEERVTNPSELGVIANLEMHNRRRLQVLDKHDAVFTKALNKPLPVLSLHRDYQGPTRIIVPSLRTSLEAGEDLNLKVMILGAKNLATATLHWRSLGQTAYRPVPLSHVARSVYRVKIPAQEIQDRDFEYYLQVDTVRPHAGTVPASSRHVVNTTVYPASAPQLNQTVVILPP